MDGATSRKITQFLDDCRYEPLDHPVFGWLPLQAVRSSSFWMARHRPPFSVKQRPGSKLGGLQGQVDFVPNLCLELWNDTRLNKQTKAKMMTEAQWLVKIYCLLDQKYIQWSSHVSGWCQDGNTSSRAITEVKHLDLNQSSGGQNFLRSGECCCRAIQA